MSERITRRVLRRPARGRRRWLSIALLSIASAALLAALAIGQGAYDLFRERALDAGPHLRLTATPLESSRRDLLVDVDDSIGTAVELVKRVGRDDRERIRNAMTYARGIEELFGRYVTAVSPYYATEALASFGASQEMVSVRGVIPDREAKLADIADHLVSGSVRRLDAAWNGVLLGEEVAARLRARTGDHLRLVSAAGETFPVQVAGIFRQGMDAYDRIAVVNLRLAQALEHALPGEATGIDLQLLDHRRAPTLAAQLRSLSGRETETWDVQHASILSSLTIVRWTLLAGALLIVISAGLVVRYGSLAETLRGRQRGRRPILIGAALDGALAGVAGTLLGGIALVLLGGMSRGVDLLGIGGFTTEGLPFAISPWYPVAAILVATMTSMLAVLGTARSPAEEGTDTASVSPVAPTVLWDETAERNSRR